MSFLARAALAMFAISVLVAACGGSEPESELGSDAGSVSRSSGASGELAAPSQSISSTQLPATGLPSVDASQAGSSAGPSIGPNGLELAFADGALGPAVLGSTIEEMMAALGPAYAVEPVEFIRVDFPAGYSVSRDDEVLFFAIEDNGVITVLMTQHSRVGLENGLRPGHTLAEAIAAHGEPTLTLGAEGREFVSFEDGTGSGDDVSVLVVVGQFGGPVGNYDNVGDGEPASGYQLEEANIKELWFWAQ